MVQCRGRLSSELLRLECAMMLIYEVARFRGTPSNHGRISPSNTLKLIVESISIGRASPIPLLLALGLFALTRDAVDSGSERRLVCFNHSTGQQKSKDVSFPTPVHMTAQSSSNERKTTLFAALNLQRDKFSVSCFFRNPPTKKPDTHPVLALSAKARVFCFRKSGQPKGLGLISG